jgi:hypothetical protein
MGYQNHKAPLLNGPHFYEIESSLGSEQAIGLEREDDIVGGIQPSWK